MNNNSTDNTESVAKEQWEANDKPTELIIIQEKTPGLSNARIKGMNEAKYELLIFCDDDMWLDSHYIEHAYDVMNSDSQIGVLGGRSQAVFEGEEPFWFSTYQGGYAIGVQALDSGDVTKRGYVWGAGMVLRKSVFINLITNGFSFYCTDRKGKLLSSGGDSEICKWFILAGYKLWYDEKLKFRHFMPKNRLTKEHLKGLHEGFKLSTVYLSKYDETIRYLSQNRTTKILVKKRIIVEIQYLLRRIDGITRKKKLQYLYPLKKKYIVDDFFYQICKSRQNYLQSTKS